MFISKKKFNNLINDNIKFVGTENEYKYKIEQLEKENKRLIDNFIKNYDYVLTYNNFNEIHLFQKGKEIEKITKLTFDAEIGSIPTFEIEVH